LFRFFDFIKYQKYEQTEKTTHEENFFFKITIKPNRIIGLKYDKNDKVET
jgi:hypothetical protein